jgi:uncharacterized protein YecA (UPF0149 family)
MSIVKDENEVNKKNMFLVMDENRELKEEFAGWKASYDDDIREACAEGIIEEWKEAWKHAVDKWKELKDENKNLKDKLLDVEETIRVAIASRLSSFFPDEKMGDHEFAEDCDIAHNLNGEDLVKMIDEWR